MNLLTQIWLRWRVWILVGGGVLGATLTGVAVQRIRATAVWRERAHVADSTARVEQRNRVRADQQAAAARAMAESLGQSVQRLTGEADRAAGRARDAQRDAQRATQARDRAIVALRGATGQGDTITALLQKSTADDSVIAAQGRAIAAGGIEIRALRSALDSANVARTTLATALDSARAQLRRDGQVIQGLQAVLRPQRAPRLTKLALSVGVGGCAGPDLTIRACVGALVGPSLRVF